MRGAFHFRVLPSLLRRLQRLALVAADREALNPGLICTDPSREQSDPKSSLKTNKYPIQLVLFIKQKSVIEFSKMKYVIGDYIINWES